MRHTEDIFFVWTGTLQELNKFKLEINQVDPLIKFHFDYSKEKYLLRHNSQTIFDRRTFHHPF